jgi:hypothetical protein
VLRLTVQERALLQNEADARGYGVTDLARMIIERALQEDLVRNAFRVGIPIDEVLGILAT